MEVNKTIDINETFEETMVLTEHLTPTLYLTLGMLAVFSISGVIGNALVLYVYISKKDRLTSTFFIIVLAAIDFITCLVIIPMTVHIEYVHYIINSDFHCKLYQFLITSNIPFSVFIMVAIAIDRYFCICHPFVQAMTMLRAQLITTVLGFYAAALGLVVACFFGVYGVIARPVETELYILNTSLQVGTNNSYTHEEITYNLGWCTKNNLIFSDKFINNYKSYHLAQYMVSLIIIVILYALIYHKVHARRNRRLKQCQGGASLPLVTRATICSAETDITALNTSIKPEEDSSPIAQVKVHSDSCQAKEEETKCIVSNAEKFLNEKKPLVDDIINTENGKQDQPASLHSENENSEKDNTQQQSNNNNPSSPNGSSGVGSEVGSCGKLQNNTRLSSVTDVDDDNEGDGLLLTKVNNNASAVPTTPITHNNKKQHKHMELEKKTSDSVKSIGMEKREKPRRASRKDRMRALNIKTAVMLSVVTIVFVVTYAPAFIMMCFGLMTEDLKPLHFLYFANNVANPIIYSFMNNNFRTDLQKIFTRRNSSFRSG